MKLFLKLFMMLNYKDLPQNRIKLLKISLLLQHLTIDVDNHLIMKNIKHKVKNIQNNALKSLYESSNIFLAQRQPKNLLPHLSRASISGNKVSN